MIRNCFLARLHSLGTHQRLDTKQPKGGDRATELSSGYEPWSFSFPQPTGKWPPYHRLNAPKIPPLPKECFYLPQCACMCMCESGLCPPGEWGGPTSCVKLLLTFHTLPQSASLWLFFPPSWSLTLFFISLWGALSAIRGTKHWFIPRVKHDPQEQRFSATHFSRRERAGENKLLAEDIH